MSLELDGADWVEILIENPQYGEYCNFSLLDVSDWCELLIHHPHFVENLTDEVMENFSFWEISYLWSNKVELCRY